MCIRDRPEFAQRTAPRKLSGQTGQYRHQGDGAGGKGAARSDSCLLYTSDAADERSSVDLGGRRIIKKKNKDSMSWICTIQERD